MEVGSIKALVVSLLAWINLYAGYDVPDQFPVIAFVPHASLEQMSCTGPCPILGWYPDNSSGVVYLDRDLALKTNVCARSILLHELVHYMQDKSGSFAEDSQILRWQLRELEAHQIQSAFLAENGVRGGLGRNFAPRAFMGPNC
ncbi:MAG: hypothetical protein V3U18_00885 [Alphaproteobacteria bacterium]